jgi:hypothetical protein
MKALPYPVTIILITSAIPGCYSQSADPKISLQQALDSQYVLTKVSADRSDIVTAGTVLVLQKDGLIMYSTASPLPPLNTYKNGKISKSFGQDLANTLLAPGNNTSASYPQRRFVTGEKFWISEFAVRKDGIVLALYSDPYKDVRYYALLKFPFDKHSTPSTADALATIAEVLSVQPPDNEPAQTEPSKGLLQNDDILKMAKAGLDDSIIIAKIKSSNCQFDTAPDTLIGLKQNGVSSAVLRAMAEASNQH